MDYITASKMLLTMNKHQHVDLYLVSNMRTELLGASQI